ncbi:class I SAM-dependent methyltransferase [Terriglobus saanensis]|uniref:Methyltransferase type 11 n=1 Tax=Terriglobus saanensis (strain ATCC BAA-1853 / DSM 23119 / SP1PR4) TaxID=401053 RepID=E8V153_TERSS|nr:class I SAM-dependent methyltransferase [Terriglobus saanensis]ADV83401.1 Methyltransferase type 11 [Terriglobus saanensis SP1PR4]
MTSSLRPAAFAFDAIAPAFDSRFGVWESVSAQRRAVRTALLQQFPAGGRVLEIGGGTGEDACFLAQRGFEVLLTDPSPTMVKLAKQKLRPFGSSAEIAAGEEMKDFATRYLSLGRPSFDGAFSNFAPLNCVADLEPVACGLARLLKPGSAAMLVFFGTCCPGEMVVESLRGRPHLALRRWKRGAVSARLAKREFQVVYHRRSEIVRAFSPWFALEQRIGIGVTVPPSAAEPWISKQPRLLAAMERWDRVLSHPLAMLGDHVLYQFRRTEQ